MHSRLLIVPASLPNLTLYHFQVLEPHCPACWFPTRHVPTDQPGFALALAFTENALLCPFGAWKPHLPVQDSPGTEGWKPRLPGSFLQSCLQSSFLLSHHHHSPGGFCVGMYACPPPNRDLFCFLPPGPAPCLAHGPGSADSY